MNKIFRLAKRNLKRVKASHYVVIILVLSLGIFNAVTALDPILKQNRREANIEKTFNKWWAEEGINQFKLVGLEPTEKIRNEEFEQYREKYLKQNHTYIVEDRIKEMKVEFREWWENSGGKEQYVQEHNVYPNEKIYQGELKKWIQKYTEKHVRYRLAFVPAEEKHERIFSAWLLSPSIVSFIIFALFFIYAFIRLEKRWGAAIFASIFLGLAVTSAEFVWLTTSTSFFHQYASARFMGTSIALAFVLGCMSRNKKDTPVAVAGLILSVLADWFVNGGIYTSVAILSPLFFGLGAFAVTKIPQRKKTEKELNEEAIQERLRKHANNSPIAAKKAKNRALVESGLNAAKKGEADNATRLLCLGMNALMQEQPIDREAVEKLCRELTGPRVFIDISGTQWLEWGETAKSKNLMEAALILLEKGLSQEKNESMARRTLYNMGEIQVNHNIDVEEGVKRLEKVINMNNSDILAAQAQKILGQRK
ncbi:MAG: hypothetical protein HUK21_06290 [Fibrobacteraceae bacterium]|nr:hypothetical protein [Fibrobacteraceae bacterium]